MQFLEMIIHKYFVILLTASLNLNHSVDTLLCVFVLHLSQGVRSGYRSSPLWTKRGKVIKYSFNCKYQ